LLVVLDTIILEIGASECEIKTSTSEHDIKETSASDRVQASVTSTKSKMGIGGKNLLNYNL
jgi:hypothetical protein